MAVALVFILCGCSWGQNEENITPSVEGVAFLVVDNSLSTSGISLCVENKLDNVVSVGPWYRVDKFSDGKWSAVEPLDGVTWMQDDWLRIIFNNSSEIIEYSWKWFLGELPSGEYRIIVELDIPEQGKFQIVGAMFFIP